MIKAGIVGLGKVAHLHAQALVNLSNADFKAVRSRSLDKARDFAQQYGVRAYEDIGRMVSDEKLDLVIICTPHPNHLDPTIDAMRAGAHVLVEKAPGFFSAGL
jgi:UDP-N-acetyl-2-amino-2-deoxyglucuronate dehydrogenase